MVSGEDVLGYPGSLPKFYYAQDLDPNHPAVSFEQKYHVDRNVPYWHGKCNGWAAAAVLYPEPTALVVNGVKFLPGELKSILSSLYLDTNAIILAGGGSQGMSPLELERVLFDTIAKDQAVIFDVASNSEVWNFPVAGFTRSSVVNGEWTEITLVVSFAATIPVREYYTYPLLEKRSYTFRYKTGQTSTAEWTGLSIEERPQLAWYPLLPYYPGLWATSNNSNRFFNLTSYEALVRLSQEPNAEVDSFEPNDQLAEAHAVENDLVLASLQVGDSDFFALDLGEGEHIRLVFGVYDGPDARFSFTNANGELIDERVAGSEEEIFEYVSPIQQRLILTVNHQAGNDKTAFYKFFTLGDTGFVNQESLTSRVDGAMLVNARGINRTTEASTFSGSDSVAVAPLGSVKLSGLGESKLVRSDQGSIWSVEWDHADYQRKQYVLDHELALPITIPHLTFKNGWDTELELFAEGSDGSIGFSVYTADGTALEHSNLMLDEDGRYMGSLFPAVRRESTVHGAWLRLWPGDARVAGSVIFVRQGGGERIRIPLVGKPINGEIAVFDLKNAGQGGTGIALVNTSGIENEVLYRVYNAENQIVSAGTYTLVPNEKVLTTARGLFADLDKSHRVHFFSQYNVDALVIQLGFGDELVYGHRPLSAYHNALNKGFISVTEALDPSELVFFNPHRFAVHVMFEGYDAAGQLRGRFNIEFGEPLRAFEVVRTTVAEILQNGINVTNPETITHFRLSADQPIYLMELVGHEGARNRTVAFPPAVFPQP